MKTSVKMALLAAAAFAATPAMAGLNLFQQFTGQYGLSTDGGGAQSGSYTVDAFAPVGATVVGAWLYQTGYNFDGIATPYGVSLNGNALTFGPAVDNATACCGLFSARANVTGIVKPIIDGGAGGTYSFDVAETNPSGGSATDGVALVVVYEDLTLGTNTVAILDGFAAVDGDSFSFNAADPLDQTAAGFFAELRLGIGFSCCGDQTSTVDVNGVRITNNAGNNDDGFGPGFNGRLITVGGNDDPFSAFLPDYDGANRDTERYDLVPYIGFGDTSIVVNTANASEDDNIFMAAFVVNAEGEVVGPVIPEPATWMMMIAGFGLVGAAARRRRVVANAA